MVVRHDPEVGHRYLPNLKARLPSEHGGFFVRTNADGFRSDVEFVRERSGRPRILFFGDSFTAGDGVENHERFSDLVGEALGAETYNYGVSGTGTDQQLLVFEKIARKMPADLIVLGIYVENIERIKVAYRESIDRFTKERVLVPKPYFTLDEAGALQLHHVPVPLTRPRAAEIDESLYQSGDLPIDPLQKLLYRPLRRVRNHPRVKAAREAVKTHLPWLMPAVLRRTGFTPYRDYASAESPSFRLMQAILQRFCAAAAPTPVLIVPIPTYYFYHDGLDPLYQPLFERLEAPSRGVHVLDLTRPLHRLPWADKKRIALAFDAHFSPFGHARVAEVIAAGIRSRNLIPERRAETMKPPTKDANGAANGAAKHGASANGASTNGPSVNGASLNGGFVKSGKPLYVLGVSCFYHDSAAALVRDGEIVAAAEEERFSRVKNDRRFPRHAANFCLEEAGISQNDLAAVVYYDNAPLTFERLMHSIAAVGPEGRESWSRILPTWLRYKLHIPQLIRKNLVYEGLVLHESHHRSHAASAFFPSPFQRAAVVTIDGVGEWATGSIGVAEGRNLRLLKEMQFPNSVGLLYSAFTQFTGFKVNSGEYKMMGLAPYGEPKYVDVILDKLVHLKDDGSVELNMEYFAFLSRPTMTNEKFAALFGGPARGPDDWLTQREMDIAKSIQVVTEEAMIRTARYAKKITGEKKLVMAGGVALNCVANGRLLREGPFEDIWIQPAAGDAGCALGAALDAYHTYFEQPRTLLESGRARQGGSYLGPSYSNEEIEAFLETHGYPFTKLDGATRGAEIGKLLAAGKVVGHLAGRLEFGPRSLGARAILGDARNQEMQQNLNLKIKYRESFRPFAPSILAERVSEYFELDRESPYMLLVAPVKESRRLPFAKQGTDLTAIVRQPRSDVPAITHVDYSARVQTVARADHPQYYDLIQAFDRLTGCPVIVNTSFNVRGEPIVNTPDDAYRCFMRTEMDCLVLGDYLLHKQAQPPWPEPKGHIEEHDDFSAKDGEYEAAFTSAIGDAFAIDFLPLVDRLGKDEVHVGTAFENLPTTWVDVRGPSSGRAVFSIPPELDTRSPDPRRMADAITRFWEPGPATDAMRAVLVKLLDVGRRFPEPDQSLEERVTHTMYVMY
ncbi:Nodulation protein nolO [Minicystis rosea]|nr:Nodulation protein nolO [Minicystis rosea]